MILESDSVSLGHQQNRMDCSMPSHEFYKNLSVHFLFVLLAVITGQRRRFFLRRLRFFNMDTRLYHCVVASLIFFAAVCWRACIWSGGANKLNDLVRKANSVVGMELDSVEVMTERMIKESWRLSWKVPLILYTLSCRNSGTHLATDTCSHGPQNVWGEHFHSIRLHSTTATNAICIIKTTLLHCGLFCLVFVCFGGGFFLLIKCSMKSYLMSQSTE